MTRYKIETDGMSGIVDTEKPSGKDGEIAWLINQQILGIVMPNVGRPTISFEVSLEKLSSLLGGETEVSLEKLAMKITLLEED